MIHQLATDILAGVVAQNSKAVWHMREPVAPKSCHRPVEQAELGTVGLRKFQSAFIPICRTVDISSFQVRGARSPTGPVSQTISCLIPTWGRIALRGRLPPATGRDAPSGLSTCPAVTETSPMDPNDSPPGLLAFPRATGHDFPSEGWNKPTWRRHGAELGHRDHHFDLIARLATESGNRVVSVAVRRLLPPKFASQRTGLGPSWVIPETSRSQEPVHYGGFCASRRLHLVPSPVSLRPARRSGVVEWRGSRAQRKAAIRTREGFRTGDPVRLVGIRQGL